MITAVLIDDDSNLRKGMKSLLSRYAPEIKILGEADSVKTGIKVMDSLKPQVVFLDIQLTDGTGFDILENLAQKNGKSSSHIVFITAHEEYAIKAFRFSALDFLLKPVDPEELEKVIEKIKSTLEKNDNYAHIDLLLENIRKKVDNFKRIALSTSDGIHLLEVSDIIRCESEDNYTKFYIKNGKPILISKTLKEYEELLAEHGFERIHQSHLINLSCLKSYIKKDGGYVIMADNSKLPISQRKKERLHELLKMI
ncbi:MULTISPECIES: LytR/AlgR family response regulator transcription factor [Flavobacterium]|jgi:two-component system LytT family response regulator|uniref:LytTR family two component transcriptional regulator n=1 Tax=Flavobacterium lindanitolerans TaxID=428988 RepID=A0A497U4A9_9FLAO|nr:MULTISPECIES: LytTR family DNA-binding domain-containing protein [Flavobacterium]MBU7569973.1 response regulator transcription factor [Flavobacterium sp.]PZO29066.1 MAG: DNA-binding response regulator [Flavobacteriaceae bacterium]THD31476.1 MAG: response regulator transcription factor [Flavobacterium johnsoniae]KQS48700.1 two-component system response regulator [Flavobacterium sp. Leaf359]MBL7866555.1 response regulator transcription factor [Flavobacterium lindanitolerans]